MLVLYTEVVKRFILEIRLTGSIFLTEEMNPVKASMLTCGSVNIICKFCKYEKDLKWKIFKYRHH